MFRIKRFCFCSDLRQGCVVYAWLQMMIIVFVLSKLKWLDRVTQVYEHHVDAFQAFNTSVLIALQTIKGICCLPLIWGVIQKNHMFYQPWLFINGLENACLVAMAMISFVAGCFEPIIFFFLIPFILLSGFGWYIWFCIYTVYKNDVRPNRINFDPNYDNITLNNI